LPEGYERRERNLAYPPAGAFPSEPAGDQQAKPPDPTQRQTCPPTSRSVLGLSLIPFRLYSACKRLPFHFIPPLSSLHRSCWTVVHRFLRLAGVVLTRRAPDGRSKLRRGQSKIWSPASRRMQAPELRKCRRRIVVPNPWGGSQWQKKRRSRC